MDHGRLNLSIVWIHLSQNERQRTGNNSWSCILGNLGGDSLQGVINEVLAAFIGKMERETLPAPM